MIRFLLDHLYCLKYYFSFSLCIAAAHYMVKAIQIRLFSVQNPCGDAALFKVRNCCLIEKPRMLGQFAGNLLAEHDLSVYDFVQRFAML